jgi:hypothetical protein
MGFNKNRLKEKFDRVSNSFLWKPQQGDNIIRILPYPHDDAGIPGIEVPMHYNIPGVRGFACTKQNFGHSCPICDLCDQLRSTGEDEDFEMFKKYAPKLRVFSPILVRGTEQDGIKWWGYGGQTLYKEILQLMMDDDYGDITDLENGFDLTLSVEAKKQGQNWSDMSLRPKRNPSPAYHDAKELDKMLKGLRNFNDCPPMKEIENSELIKYLHIIGGDVSDQEPQEEAREEPKQEAASEPQEKPEGQEKPQEAASEPQEKPQEDTPAVAETPEAGSDEFKAKFDNFFKKD